MAEGIKPKCDFCSAPAIIAGKTSMGPWAYMCSECFNKLGTAIYTDLEYANHPPTKRCRICGVDKPLTAFYKYTDHTGTTRYRSECIACNLKKRRIT